MVAPSRFNDPDFVLKFWANLLETPRSRLRRLIGAILISGAGIGLIDITYQATGHYFSAFPVTAATIATIDGGYASGLAVGVTIALFADYFYLPPIGSVLDSGTGFLHLAIIVVLTLLMIALITSLRTAFGLARTAWRTADSATRAMNRTLSLVSHDLRNPITAARSSAELIEKRRADPEKSILLAKSIRSALDRADRMIQEMLDAQRYQSGAELRLKLQYCDLRSLAGDIVHDLSAVYGERFVLEAQEPVRGEWSPVHVRRAVENLAINAVKYGSSQVPIVIGVNQDAEEARVSVHNRGNPIPQAEQAKLFDPFHRSHPGASENAPGWGLGLVTVSLVARSHGGSVSLVSTSEAGTTFVIHLPKKNRARVSLPDSPNGGEPIEASG